jgi:hypothetical protein
MKESGPGYGLEVFLQNTDWRNDVVNTIFR